MTGRYSKLVVAFGALVLTGCVVAPGGSSSVVDSSCLPVRSHFGDTTNFDGSRRRAPHNGVDVPAPKGTPIIAAAPGVVVSMNEDSMHENLGGKYVLLYHGEHGSGRHVFSGYVHMNAFSEGLTEQAIVARGTILGFVGNTGTSWFTRRNPHLHGGAVVNDTGSFYFLPRGPDVRYEDPLTFGIGEDGRVLPFDPSVDYGDELTRKSESELKGYKWEKQFRWDYRFVGFTYPLECG